MPVQSPVHAQGDAPAPMSPLTSRAPSRAPKTAAGDHVPRRGVARYAQPRTRPGLPTLAPPVPRALLCAPLTHRTLGAGTRGTQGGNDTVRAAPNGKPPPPHAATPGMVPTSASQASSRPSTEGCGLREAPGPPHQKSHPRGVCQSGPSASPVRGSIPHAPVQQGCGCALQGRRPQGPGQ